MIKKGFRRFKHVEVPKEEHPPSDDVTMSYDYDDIPLVKNRRKKIGLAVPHPPSGRREYCKTFKIEQKDLPYTDRQTISSLSRRAYRPDPMDQDLVPHPPSLHRYSVLPPISKKEKEVAYPPLESGKTFKCREFSEKQKNDFSLDRETFSSSQKRRCKPKTLKDFDPDRPSENLDMEHAKKGIAIKKPSLKEVRESLLSDYKKSMKQLEIQKIERYTIGPQRSPDWFEFCKRYKDELTEKHLERQDTFNSWWKRLPKQHKDNHFTNQTNDSLSSHPKEPEIKPHQDLEKISIEYLKTMQENKYTIESPYNTDTDSLLDLDNENSEPVNTRAERDKAKAEREFLSSLSKMELKNISVEELIKMYPRKYSEEIEAEPESETTDYEAFSRKLAKQCLDLWVMDKYITDLKKVWGNDDIDAYLHTESKIASKTPRKFAMHWKKVYKQPDTPDFLERRSRSSKLSITKPPKFMNKLRHIRACMHSGIKKLIRDRKMTDFLKKAGAEMMIEDAPEYEKLQNTRLSYRLCRSQIFIIMLPEWHENFNMNLNDPFYFKNPEDLVAWMKSLKMNVFLEIEDPDVRL